MPSLPTNPNPINPTVYKRVYKPNAALLYFWLLPLQSRQNERDGVSNHKFHDCLRNRLFKAQIIENIKAPRHCHLCGEFTGDRWIPRTKGQ